MNNKHNKSSLSFDDINSEVLSRLKRYENLNLLEKFAMFMGTVQVLEISLKQLLIRKYKIEFESIENLTLGQVTGRLETNGIRPDFIKYLKSVVGYRNYIAHSLLANQIMLHSLGLGEARFEQRELDKGIYELEQLCFFYEWTEERDSWD